VNKLKYKKSHSKLKTKPWIKYCVLEDIFHFVVVSVRLLGRKPSFIVVAAPFPATEAVQTDYSVTQDHITKYSLLAL